MPEADRLIAEGQLLEDKRELDAALARYRDAIAVAPGYARARMNAGNALGKLERWDEALEQQRMAVECAPDYAPAHFNHGAFLFNRGKLAAAADALLEASRLQPDMHEAPILLADVYELQERFDDAEEQYKRALDIAPGHAGTMLNFGWFCVRQGRMADALHWLQRARAADPELRSVDGQILFAMNFRADLTPVEIAQEHRRTGTLITRSAGRAFSSWPNDPDPSRRLRIAYVSGDFGPHPVAFFMRPVLQHHDRRQFEVYGYSNSNDRGSIADSLRARADHWRTIANVDDAAVIRQIQDDRVDILVDLSGHTARGRISVFARHPAPVQATWLGYLNTSGLAAMDYRITDAHTDPEGATERLHTERLIRMPHSQWCYSASDTVDLVMQPHEDRKGAIVFGSFNQCVKISDECLALWSRILAKVPGSELLAFDVRQARTRDALLARMKAHGIDAARVTLRGRETVRDYFNAIGNVDVALDTFPYNGATTTLDALWMGVPVVGLRGDRGISRGTYSILRTLQADDLIAKSAEEYVDINVRLARDREWRNRLRNTLRTRLAASPLTDAAAFTRALEAHYREMWRSWCVSHPRIAGSGEISA